jgi:hypothetical protein
VSVEALKSLFDVLAVVLLGLTFVAGAGVLITGNIINRRQSEQLKTFDSDMTKAKSDLAAQEERAATAEGKIAGLQKDASDAKASQQNVEIALESQREKTAKAEEKLLEVAKRQGNRWVENHSVEKALKGKPTGTLTIWYQPNDPEAYWFAWSIMAEVLSSGWKVSQPIPVPNDISSSAFMGPEYMNALKSSSGAIDQLDRTRPPLQRIVGGNSELTLLSNSPEDKNKPDELVSLLTNALKPLVFSNWGWRIAQTLPDDEFILIVGPKP